MATPYTRLKTADLSSLLSTTLGNLKPYQLKQVMEVLDRTNYVKGTQSDVSGQPTISTIATALGTNNP